jgi:hypothetical protein
MTNLYTDTMMNVPIIPVMTSTAAMEERKMP